MPRLHDLLDLIETRAAKSGVDPAFLKGIEHEIRLRWGGERIYCAPLDSRKNPERTARARELARTLPTGVVAKRTGLSEGYVRSLVARKRNN